MGTSQISSGIGVGFGRSGCSEHQSCNISDIIDMGQGRMKLVLLTTYIKSYTRYQVLPQFSGVAGPLAARCGGHICRLFVIGFGNRQARREVGEKRESFPGSRNVWGPPPSFKNTEKVLQIATFWPPQICIKSIFGRDSAPDPAGGSSLQRSRPLIGWWGDSDTPFPPYRRSMSTFNLNLSVIFFKISPVCCPWQMPPGAARTSRTPFATPLPQFMTFNDLYVRLQIFLWQTEITLACKCAHVSCHWKY